MVVIFIRTLIIYTCLLISMRLMGKRQIGQLDISDLVTTLLISEIASLPIENPDIPVFYAIIPTITLLSFEVASSTLLSKSQFMKNIFSTRPAFLVKNGIIMQKELSKNRISLDELMSKLRQQGANNISEIKYAILEQDGLMSVIFSAPYRTVELNDLKLNTEDDGISHIVISNGTINKHSLNTINRDVNWVKEQLAAQKVNIKDVFLMTVNDSYSINITKKDK